MSVIHPLTIKVLMQGAVMVNAGHVTRKSKNMATLEIDLHTKYAELGGYGDSVLLVASERSLDVEPTLDRDSMTIIEFPQFKNWQVFLADVGRYTLKVCLVRKAG